MEYYECSVHFSNSEQDNDRRLLLFLRPPAVGEKIHVNGVKNGIAIVTNVLHGLDIGDEDPVVNITAEWIYEKVNREQEMIGDTHTMTLHQDEFEFPDGAEEFSWTEEHVRFMVDLAFHQSELTTPMKFLNFGVTEVVKGTVFSKVAYIESGSGYFIISEDMMLHINITYSRWD